MIAKSVSQKNVHELGVDAPRDGQFAPDVVPLAVLEMASHVFSTHDPVWSHVPSSHRPGDVPGTVSGGVRRSLACECAKACGEAIT